MFEKVNIGIHALRRRWHRLPTLSTLLRQNVFYVAVSDCVYTIVGVLEAALADGEKSFNSLTQSGDGSYPEEIDFHTVLVTTLLVLFFTLSYLRNRHRAEVHRG